MRPRYLIANWKMNLPPEGISSYLDRVGTLEQRPCATVVCPPFTHLRDVRGKATLGAQNCAAHLSGAFTGEIAPGMLRDEGVTHVLLGHSERRALFGESDDVIARKLRLALETGFMPVLCVGEDLKARDEGITAELLASQIRHAAMISEEKLVFPADKVIVAYEPVWAIGTGRNATSEICRETCDGIRRSIERFWDIDPDGVSILYGGSVTPENAGDLMANGNVDGFLVGGASLDSQRFSQIHLAMLSSRSA